MLSKIIRIFLWWLIHVCYTIIENLHFLWTRATQKVVEIRRLRRYKDSFKYVYQNMRDVKKVPAHVVLLLGEDDVAFEDLGRLVIWSLAAGISYFSFYDKTGFLKQNEEKLFSIVKKLKADVPGHIKWTNQPELNGYKNGANLNTTVNFLTLEDGKSNIISIVKNMCNQTKKGELDPDTIDVDYLNRVIGTYGPQMPEPNLAIYFGRTCQTNGLLPWQIRLTEFLSLGDPHHVKVEGFVSLLRNYGDCEQRFGK